MYNIIGVWESGYEKGWLYPCCGCHKLTGRSFSHNEYVLWFCKDCMPKSRLNTEEKIKDMIKKMLIDRMKKPHKIFIVKDIKYNNNSRDYNFKYYLDESRNYDYKLENDSDYVDVDEIELIEPKTEPKVESKVESKTEPKVESKTVSQIRLNVVIPSSKVKLDLINSGLHNIFIKVKNIFTNVKNWICKPSIDYRRLD